MISEEAALKTALKEVEGQPDLNAENIQVDDNNSCELITLDGTVVWAVRFTYTNQGDTEGEAHGGIVMVDAFSGEVFRVYLSA